MRTLRWLMSVDSSYVMCVTRTFVFEGVSKTTHRIQYSYTTDAIFSLVYMILYAGVWSVFLFLFIFWWVYGCVRATAIRRTECYHSQWNLIIDENIYHNQMKPGILTYFIFAMPFKKFEYFRYLFFPFSRNKNNKNAALLFAYHFR